MEPAKKALVSIIVPAYNHGIYIGECLDSVISQTFKDWECIIVDNGSTDNTSVIVNAYVLKDSRFRYHYTSQKGVSFARNTAVALSTGTYILPLDSDDKIAAAYLEKAVKTIESDKGVDLVYCDAELFGVGKGKWILPEYSFKGLLIENSIFCTALYRKSDFETAGGYNENMKEGFEDWDFWIKLMQRGGRVHRIRETLFYYRIRPESRNNSLSEERQRRLRRQIFENHTELYQKTFSIPDLLFDNHNLLKETAAVLTSREYRLGTTLLKPLRFIKKLLKRAQA
ncbi:MAG TPA: glycosyltransferase [Bacteroidia bacterium]|mgnify:CR=1 FL=1|nr:glycosyltransferase [Bacteroidia bacterium]